MNITNKNAFGVLIFERTKDEATNKMLCTDELRDFWKFPSVVRVVKSRSYSSDGVRHGILEEFW